MNEEIDAVLAAYGRWFELVVKVEEITNKAIAAREMDDQVRTVKLLYETVQLSDQITEAMVLAHHATTTFLEKHKAVKLPPPD